MQTPDFVKLLAADEPDLLEVFDIAAGSSAMVYSGFLVSMMALGSCNSSKLHHQDARSAFVGLLGDCKGLK
jgi:hypothetical protein